MSFVEIYGAEYVLIRQKQNELMQCPAEFYEKPKAIIMEKGIMPTNNIYQVSDGLYCAKTEFEELSQETQFRLDGTPITNKRVPDGKEMESKSSFADEEWILTLKIDGSPDFVTKKTRSGDEILSKDSVGDIYIEDYLVLA